MPDKSNLIILKICLSFLLFRKIDDKATFMIYAAHNWDAHFRFVGSRVDESLL